MLPKFNLTDIRERMFNRPLMVTRERAQAALGVMGPKLNVGSLFIGADGGRLLSLEDLKANAAAARSAVESLPGDGHLKKRDWNTGAEVDPYETWNGAAIFQVRGTLMAENGIDPVSGATGYDGLGFKARHAEANSAVKGVILDIDSGGGEVVDLLELCTQLRALAEKKPMRAIIRGTGCSAAYALAACAGRGNITCADYSVVGSIGSIMLHADFSKYLESEGVDVTLITSAEHKADGNQYEPLEADVAARLQAMVDQCAGTLIDHVADARGVDRGGIEAQEARFYSGEDVLRLGLADKFMPWDASMREFAEGLGGRRSNQPARIAPSGARSQAKETSMSTEAEAPAQGQPDIEAVCAEAHAAGHAEGRAEGIAAERERITAITEIGGGSLSAAVTAAIEAGTEPGAFAVEQSRAKKAKLVEATAAAASEAANAGDLPGVGAAAKDPAKPGQANRGQAYRDKKASQKAG